MRIVLCTKCKKYTYQTAKCLYCGNTIGFDEIETPVVHENVIAEYAKIETLIEEKKFAEAFSLSHAVIEWMPNFANIFWLRLLAKKKCTCAAELIQKGFNCEDDADFNNALEHSTGIEHSIYLDVQNLVRAVKRTLKVEIIAHEYQCKNKTNIHMVKKNMEVEMEARKKKLFSLWADLEATEQSMYTIEKDFFLLSKEYGDSLSKAAQEASSLKNETYRLEECTAKIRHEYQVKIGSILQHSEQAKEAIESIKGQHPWVNTFNELVKKRDEQVGAISNEISSLRVYEESVQQTLDEIDRIEDRHRSAVRAVEAYNFLDAANLLGNESYNNVLHSIGLGIDVLVSVSSQEWKPSITDKDSVDNGDCEEVDDYSAWGLPIK